MVCVAQVVNKKLKDTKGGYAQFLRENVGEAKVMEEKEKRVKVLEQSTVKAKSKVSCTTFCEKGGHRVQPRTSHSHVTCLAPQCECNFVQNAIYLWQGKSFPTEVVRFWHMAVVPVCCARSKCGCTFLASNAFALVGFVQSLTYTIPLHCHCCLNPNPVVLSQCK